MSVILTAAKKSVAQKSKPKSKPKQPAARGVIPPASGSDQQKNFDPTPPMSSEKTTVWHWELDGLSTTVMFQKDTGVVWCNGGVLDTRCPFGGPEQQVVEFTLEVKPSRPHVAKIRRISKGRTYKDTEYQLYVDTISILEHSTQQPYAPVSDDLPPDEFPIAPPAYDYMDPKNQASPFDKKTK